jgi:hypothetical protein
MLAPSTHPFRVRIQIALAGFRLGFAGVRFAGVRFAGVRFGRVEIGGVAQLGERRLCKP